MRKTTVSGLIIQYRLSSRNHIDLNYIHNNNIERPIVPLQQQWENYWFNEWIAVVELDVMDWPAKSHNGTMIKPAKNVLLNVLPNKYNLEP